MFENINDGDHITLKLASGEEVIAKYKSGQDSYIGIKGKRAAERTNADTIQHNAKSLESLRNINEHIQALAKID